MDGRKVVVVNKQEKIYKFRSKTYRRGLREDKDVKIDKFVQTTATPTYEELYDFQKTGILCIEVYGRALRDIMALSFKEGSKVTIIAGPQTGLKGVVKELVDQSTIRVEFATDQTSFSTIDIPNQYVKVTDYKMGDLVKVTRGDRKDVVGLVVEATEEGIIIHAGKDTV
jgi:transcription elongation factor